MLSGKSLKLSYQQWGTIKKCIEGSEIITYPCYKDYSGDTAQSLDWKLLFQKQKGHLRVLFQGLVTDINS